MCWYVLIITDIMIVWICVSIPVYLEEIGMIIDINKLDVEKNF